MSKLFVTGFPGFLGGRLVRELLLRNTRLEIVALIQQKFLHAAETFRGRLHDEAPSMASRLQFVFGDITAENLGIDDDAMSYEGITGVYHLAAAYDLAIPRSRGMLINVEGTENVINFARRCRNLTRFDYVSTAYVSGTFTGSFSEHDFDKRQDFKNYYEETKYLAEKVVREAGDLPAVIYRPGIVVGDSLSGETAKYDGPYYALRAMDALPDRFPFPLIGKGTVKVNLVPVDYVIAALAAIWVDDAAVGRTFHLTDPDPLTVSELQEMFAGSLGKHFIKYPLPEGLARLAKKMGIVRSIYRMPPQLIDYFAHNVHYDSRETTDFLAKYKIKCPNFAEYWPNLFKFYQTHKEDQLQGILI